MGGSDATSGRTSIREGDIRRRGAPSIWVVGSANVDMVTYARRIPAAGETLVAQRFELGTGGKGANQAVMAARLGAQVVFVGAVGTDSFGAMLLDALAAEGIDVSRVLRLDKVSSGVAPIWVEPGGANRILIVPGANDRIDPSAAGQAVAAGDADVVLGQFEIPQAATIAAFGAGKSRGAITVLNPAPAAPLETDLLAVTDWLVPNEAEFASLAGEAGEPVAAGAIPDADAVERVQRAVGPGLVVTLGAAGAIAVPVGGPAVVVPAPEVVAVDTTGAGDAFVGAFAVGLASGVGVVEAVEVACACASDSVTRPGTQRSFPDRATARRLAASFRIEADDSPR
jgi:ribokinase